jgi:integrase
VKTAVPTLAEWWETYLRDYTPAKAQNTQAHDRFAKSVYCAMAVAKGSTFGEMRLDEIKQVHCLAALRLRRQMKAANPKRKNPTVISEGTVQRDRRLLQAVFERAVGNDHIVKNPWKGIDAKPDVSRKDRILTEAAEVAMIKALRKPVKDAVGRAVSLHPRYERFIAFMLETGLRIDELLNEHFTHKGDYIHVRGKFSKDRSVPLTQKARRILNEQWKDPGDPRSPRPKNGGPWWQNEDRFRQVMTRACAKAKIDRLSPHDLRHTFGHRYLVRGGDIYDLSKILGHASVAVTERHYAYLRKEDVRAKMLAVMG